MGGGAFAVFAAILRLRFGASSGLSPAVSASFGAFAPIGESAVHCKGIDRCVSDACGYEICAES